MEKYSQVIFDKNTVEFVTVAAEYCGFLERARDMKRYDFVDTALKILPLLYLKATLLPPCEPIGEDEPEIFVTEEDYELIRRTVAGVLGAKDAEAEVEKEIIIKESEVDESIALKLVGIAGEIRQLSDTDIQEAVSTRLLIYAAKLIKKGFNPYNACMHSIVESLSDEDDVLEVLEKLISLHFEK